MDFTKGLLLRLWLVAAVSQHFDTWQAIAQGKPCEDELEDCSTYFTAGECEKYNGLTRQYCARTCGYCTALQATRQPECKDLLSDCSVLIKSPSQCHPAKDFFTKYCPMTCGYCACVDLLPDCLAYAFNPDNCQSSAFFTKYCRRSCSLCGEQTTQSATATHPTTGHRVTPPPSSAKSSRNPESSTNSSPAPVYSSPKSPPAPESSTNSSPDPIYSSSESSLSSRSFSSTPVPTVTSTTTVTTDNNVLPPGPIGCSDIYPECASRVKNDPELCGEEIVKEQCPESCKLCDVDPYCEDKTPKDCKNRIAEDKTSCKTNPEYMRENCARSCEHCGCDDLLPVCAALVRSNKDYCDSNRLFMKTNCPRSCDFCAEAESISDEPQKNVDPTQPSPPSEEDDCVDRRKRCKLFAGKKDYCRYHTQFMSRYCPKACEFCKKVRSLYKIELR